MIYGNEKKVNLNLKILLNFQQIVIKGNDESFINDNNIERLKAMTYGRHCNDEDLDMFYRMKFPSNGHE